jgi:hypothetical protein
VLSMHAFPRKMPIQIISDRVLSCFEYSILTASGPPLSLSADCVHGASEEKQRRSILQTLEERLEQLQQLEETQAELVEDAKNRSEEADRCLP